MKWRVMAVSNDEKTGRSADEGDKPFKKKCVTGLFEKKIIVEGWLMAQFLLSG